MRILWVSSIAWKGKNGYPYPVNGPGAIAGSLFQQALIEELEKAGHVVDIVSAYPYAGGSNLHCKIEWKHRDGAADVFVKTIDIPYFSLLYKSKSLKKEVEKNLKNNIYDVAVAYLIHQPFLDAIAYAKKGNPNLKTVLICPDLPDMMDMSLEQKKLKTFLKKLDMKRISALYRKMDGFVLFTEAMKEKIPVKEMKYTVIEGVANLEDLDTTPGKKEKFIMYAGTVHKNIGIENIIKSVDFIDDKEIQLKIYGTGELEPYVKDVSTYNKRIIYGGFIDRKELFEEEKKAIALVNARNPEDAYTRYSFPSKTFEYLYSGTPFVTTKLEGVPKEYEKYLVTLEDNSPQSIASNINTICLMDDDAIFKHGSDARRFITEEKSKAKQTKKLEIFLNSLIKENMDETIKKKRKI